MNEGWSAEQKAQELAASGDASARAWAAGADGERRVGAELSTLREAWTVLHDRLLRPGQSEANLDHVIIGPAGLVLVDAKNWSGSVTAWDGGLFQHLGPSGSRTSHSKHAEVAKVHSMAMAMAVETGMPVTPVICLAGASEATFGEPQCIRGVWVVPLSHLVAWLESRPPTLERDDVVRASTRAMTSFPSTTTDPDLLAAMGAAASVGSRPRRRQPRVQRAAGGGRQRPKRVTQVEARPPLAARIGRFIGGAFIVVLVLSLFVALVPKLLGFGLERLSGASPTATPSGDVPPSQAPLSGGRPPVAQSKTPAPSRPPDCSAASGAQIGKILGRKVQPIAVINGCAWGARLDDASTTLVTIRMSAKHASYDTQFVTSVKQHRVVYGAALDSRYQPATALWVASGQPITKGKAGVTARADTQVVVAATALKVSDDNARRMATAIAAAANN